MAISSIKSERKKGMGVGFTPSDGVSSTRTDTTQTHASQRSSNVKKNSFQEILTKEVHIADNSASLNVILPNGELNEVLLGKMQDEIHILGDQLLAKPGYNTVLQYKSAIQSLLTAILPHLQKKEETEVISKSNGEVKKRKLILVHTVNQKLDTLLKVVMSTQKDQMQIMHSLDEIRGLIIDILR